MEVLIGWIRRTAACWMVAMIFSAVSANHNHEHPIKIRKLGKAATVKNWQITVGSTVGRKVKPFNHWHPLSLIFHWPSDATQAPRFDKNSASGKAIVAVEPEVAPQIQEVDWPNEPTTVDDLLNAYNLECKCPGRWPGTTLYLVESKGRNGKTENVVDGQGFKLFLAA